MRNQLPKINHNTVVFTKHARERSGLRSVNDDMIIQVMRNPVQTQKVEDGKIKFIGKVMGAKVHVVSKPIVEENKWLVITIWVRGEDDAGNFTDSYKRWGRRLRFALPIQYLLMVIVLVVIILYVIQRG